MRKYTSTSQMQLFNGTWVLSFAWGLFLAMTVSALAEYKPPENQKPPQGRSTTTALLYPDREPSGNLG